MSYALEIEGGRKNDASPRGDTPMNRISAVALLAIASVATCAGAMAQQSGLRANIPFGFTVGNTWMPAGEYTVTSPNQGVLELKSGNHIAFVASIKSYGESNSGSKLVFDKYDDQYFLHEVLCPVFSSLNLQIPASNLEKRARERSIEANGSVNRDKIMLAAR
jgi:hypothetical protein